VIREDLTFAGSGSAGGFSGVFVLESNAAEMCFFVPAKNGAQHFLGEPAIEQVELLLVVYVFEVVIEDSDITDTFFHGFRGEMGCAVAGSRSRVLEGTPDYGASAVDVVSVNRPESTEICAQHLQGEGGGFCFGDATGLFDT
jgi:hypothetical protein